MLFNHKVYVQYATKFFILKFDTYQQVTTHKNFFKLWGSNTGVGCGKAQSLSEEWHSLVLAGMHSAAQAQAEKTEEFLSCLHYSELLSVIPATSTKVKLLSNT